MGSAQLNDAETTLKPQSSLRFEAVLNCPLCGNDSFSEYLKLAVDRLVLAQCNACGLIFLNPRLDEASMNRYYQDVYWRNREVMRVAQGSESLAERLHDYFKHHGIGHYYRSREEILDRYCRERSILEVGCGEGSFLRYLESKGWEAHGIDISLEGASGVPPNDLVKIVFGDFMAMPTPTVRYANIAAFHLLEHLYQPRAALRRMFGFLKPGGFLFLEVPSIGSLQAQIFGEHWSELAVPVHVNFFNPKTLQYVLQSEGFKVIHISHRPSFHSVSGWRISLLWGIGRSLALLKTFVSNTDGKIDPKGARNDHPYYDLLVSGCASAGVTNPKVSHELFYRFCLNPMLAVCAWVECCTGRGSVITVCARKPV